MLTARVFLGKIELAAVDTQQAHAPPIRSLSMRFYLNTEETTLQAKDSLANVKLASETKERERE